MRSLLRLALGLVCVSCSDDGRATGGAPSGGSGSGATTSTGGSASGAGGAGAGAAQGAGGSGGGGAGAFVLEVHTSLESDSLRLSTNLPREDAACLALATPGAPCGDVDQDGLTDAWEDVVLDRLRPTVVLDEDEQLVGDPSAVQGLVGRVAPVGGEIRAFMMLGYSKDYGSCGGFTGHNGDSERVALSLAPIPNGGPGDVVVTKAYTAAHEGTATDHGHVYAGAELSELVFETDPSLGEPRWSVFSSADKHATYASIAVCEGISIVPCFDEDCAPDGVADPAPYRRLFALVNAGEETSPRVSDLTGLGFPGDDAWAMQDFCGGLGGSGCSSPVRDKLLVDPF